MSDHFTRQVTLVTGVGGDIGTATSGQRNIRVNAMCPGEMRTPVLPAGVKQSRRPIASSGTLLWLGHVEPWAEVSAPITLLTADEAPSPCSAAVEVTRARAVA
jgi:2-hydroxycyclohexanecarboxyl-CoA dehydrogenase